MSSSILQHSKQPNETTVPTRNVEHDKKWYYKVLFIIVCAIACLPTNIVVLQHFLEQKYNSIHNNQNVANFSSEGNQSFGGQDQPPSTGIGEVSNDSEQVKKLFNLIQTASNAINSFNVNLLRDIKILSSRKVINLQLGLPKNATKPETNNASVYQDISDQVDKVQGCYELIKEYNILRKDAQLWIEGILLFIFGIFGIFGNILSIAVLPRCPGNRNFNTLLM